MIQQSAVKQNESNKTIDDLPDHFIISVIGTLSTKERLNCSRVCKKWNRCSRDPSIWSVIDLRDYKNTLSLSELKQIISTLGSSFTKQFLVCGNFTFDYVPILSMESLQISENKKPKKRIITELDSEFITDYLCVKCPNLSLVSFEYLCLKNIKFGHIAHLNKLSTFSLRWCNIQLNWFNLKGSIATEKVNPEKFTNIKNLNLFRTGLLNTEDIKTICKLMPNLIVLMINQAVSSLGDDSIEVICESLIHLEKLDLINTIISDNAVYNICNSTHLCSNLKRLNLTMSSKLSNNCLNSIADNLHGLDTLYLTSCFGISNISFLQNLKNLIYLNINNTSIDKNRIKQHLLPNLNPKCEVEYGHTKMLNSKLTWTINNSRNSVCSF